MLRAVTNDELLQRLYDLSLPDARVRGEPLEAPADEVLLYWQACGITYERDDLYLIDDQLYDGLAWWLNQRLEVDLSAGTAMDWRSYPPEAVELADRLKEAKENRDRGVVCPECWRWWPPRTCTCSS